MSANRLSLSAPTPTRGVDATRPMSSGTAAWRVRQGRFRSCRTLPTSESARSRTDGNSSTKVAGLFLFLPVLLDLDLPQAVKGDAKLPGSKQIPPLQGAACVVGSEADRQAARQSYLRLGVHFDEGAGLFARPQRAAQDDLRGLTIPTRPSGP